jgi:hypothetical protein
MRGEPVERQVNPLVTVAICALFWTVIVLTAVAWRHG